MSAIASAIGPLFGGIMTSFFSWRYGFACELIVVILILLVKNKIPNFIPTESINQLDITGAIISFIGLILLIFGILTLTEDITNSMIIILGIIVLLIFAFFEIRRKRNGKTPLLDVELFKDRNLRVGSIIMLICFLTMEGGLFAVSIYLQSVLQLSSFDTGLTILLLTLSLLILSMVTPKLSEKFSHKTLMAVGSILAIIGCLILDTQFRLDTTPLSLMPGMFVLGAGFGIIMALNVDIALFNIPAKSQNNASCITSIGQSLGESMGTAIIGVILILGVFEGISHAIDIHAPEYLDNDTFHQEIIDNFQTIDNINDAEADSTVVNIVNIIIQDTMSFVMIVTAILMAIVFVLTFRLKDRNT